MVQPSNPLAMMILAAASSISALVSAFFLPPGLI
jgi:hypothetical protein